MARRASIKASASAPWREDAMECVRVLRAGGIVACATDTIWGLACRADDPKALARLATIKNRPEGKPFLLLLAQPNDAAKYAKDIAEAAWDLMEVPEADDRPMTVVLPRAKTDQLQPAVIGPEGTVAVRAVLNDYLQFIIRGVGAPLASTSPNRSDDPTPKGFRQIDKNVLAEVDYVGRWARDGKWPQTSNIVGIDEFGRIDILRP
jgi:L-threonylcarbamoyladenylate synthase